MATDEELYQALLKADRSESLAAMVQGLTRELNQELAKIVAGVALARSRDPDSEPLAAAEAGSLAARELTRRLLAMCRKDGAGAETTVPARDLLEEAARSAGAGASAEISVHVAEGTRPVWGEHGPLLQVFQALVRNAVEALQPPPARPRIQLNAANAALSENQVAGLAAGDYVEFEVRDNGAGIAAENLERIWDPFFTTRRHGTGLGLASALAAVRRYGGQIGVDSAVGVGTVFTVFLPHAHAVEYAGGRTGAGARFRTGRILVMDGDERMRSLAAGLLEKLDYRCDLARDGEDAVIQYRRYWDVGRPHDAVLLEARVLGGMGAEEIFARLREFDPGVRAVLCGSASADELKASADEHGFAGWLAKPYKLSELAAILQTVGT
ncbi:MAG: ATP-binding protein [Opitutaceae bacterium]